MMPAYGNRTTGEGIAVVGEAIRRVSPETVEFVMEVVAAGNSAAQAMHDHHAKVKQIGQAISGMGAQRSDMQTVSLNVMNVFGAVMPALPGYGIPQIPAGNFGGFPGAPAVQPDIQFGTYQAKSLVRVTVRDAARAAEIADAAVKTGATLVGGLSYRAADESGARRLAVEAAGKDARAKAETLAAAAGKQLGDPISITEEIVAANGVYSALRTQAPWAFGPDTPPVAGELEYYARVSASFRFQ